MVCSSLPSGDNGGCTSELWEAESSSVINSVMARMHAAVSSAEMASMASMASIAGYVVWSWNLPPNNLALIMIYLGRWAQAKLDNHQGCPAQTEYVAQTQESAQTHSPAQTHKRVRANCWTTKRRRTSFAPSITLSIYLSIVLTLPALPPNKPVSPFSITLINRKCSQSLPTTGYRAF
jgi:hypothetical protein